VNNLVQLTNLMQAEDEKLKINMTG